MKTKKEKTTVLFVNKDAQGIKPMKISSGLLLNWKKYLAGIFIIFLALIGTIVYLSSHSIQQHQKQVVLTKQVETLDTVIEQVDTNAVRDKFANIDKELTTINGYLKARGIKPVFKGPEGGEPDDGIISTNEITDFYAKYLHRIAYNIGYIPLGMPYHGIITSTFGHRENPFGGGNVEVHKGLDIAAPYGAPVRAMAKGTVEFAGLRGGFGNCIMLKHGNGFETLYGHLSKILVKVGQPINIGEQIGRVGSTGRSTGPHLHYEIHHYGEKINPQPFLTLN
ncbi:MAG TPA: peptidoglycan DD-metalloendopeptidase family protein [Hanamia sp.]|nr:peptidoglycan DD-metalloendopeptidase family protein [Hanamia sp.]